MINKKLRSDCPINFSLQMLGDTWSLLIIRDLIFANKHTFGEFLNSDEGIARNILTNRLQSLEQEGLIKKKPHPSDKRKDLYQLTEKGLDLIPVLIELSLWGSKYEPITEKQAKWLQDSQLSREALIDFIKDAVRQGKGIFD
ncbi:winged helix-turn-helix transcriptional regulator [Amphibacillus sediminis]|uniref:winged helix-turn-helix transcriptional regulator n=1 Tax=Amphibacillus sediminis TaxID=360185 RepID=UPI0008342A16|nr:helix-turn-helix domain-containing protein [Amphibacillus sediminis]